MVGKEEGAVDGWPSRKWVRTWDLVEAAKGKAGKLEAAAEIRRLFGVEARRGQHDVKPHQNFQPTEGQKASSMKY